MSESRNDDLKQATESGAQTVVFLDKTAFEELRLPRYEPIEIPTEPGYYWCKRTYQGTPYLSIESIEFGDVHEWPKTPWKGLGVLDARDGILEPIPQSGIETKYFYTYQWYGPKIEGPAL